MKNVVNIIVLALSCTIANSQNTSSSHQVRANDEVKKQQVEYAAVDSTGQNMVWDLSEVVLPKWTLTADYTEQIRVIDEVACQSNRPLIYAKKPQQTKSIAILLPHILYFAPLPALSR
jgi:hypothetical protein